MFSGGARAEARAPGPDVLITYEAGTEETLEPLIAELQLMGIKAQAVPAPAQDLAVEAHDTELEPGEAPEAQPTEPVGQPDALNDPQGARLHIFLLATGGAQIRSADSQRTRDVPRAPGESADHVALRTAELARANLLSADSAAAKAPLPEARRLSLTVAPMVIINGYGDPTGGLGQDLTVWFGRFGIGPAVTLTLGQQSWRPDPKHFNLRTLGLGLQARYSLAPRTQQIMEAQLLAIVGSTTAFLSEQGGKDADRFSGTGWGGRVGVGIDVGFRVAPHFRVGLLALGEAVMMFSWPEDDGLLGPKEAELLLAESEAQKLRHQVTFATALTAYW